MKIPFPLLEALPLALMGIFKEGRPSDRVVDYYLRNNKKWGSRDRRFFAEAVFECVRHYRLYWVRLGFSREDFLNPEVVNVDRMRKIMALYLQDKHPTFTLPPNWKVEEKGTAETFAEKESYSDYLDQLGRSELKNDWESVAHAVNEKAPVYLRVNTLKSNLKQVQQRLLEEGVETEVISDVEGCLRLKERKNVFITKCYLDGGFEVQDKSSQRVAPLLAPQPGERVVDGCAGAGGKTLHLAAMMQNKGKIIAMDIHDRKLEELRKRANRAGAMLIETKPIESSKTIKRLEGAANALLLDVPCSGSGVIRRNPDTKWRFSEKDWNTLLQTQSEILKNYSEMVKPGGRMVYATCSVFPSENDEQIKKFLDMHKQWKLETKRTVLPDREDGDGFFMALLLRDS